METILSIIAVILAIWAIFHTANVSDRLEVAEDKLAKCKDTINAHARSGNEHLRALKELADQLGYCIHEEREVKFDLASIFGQKEPEWSSPKLIVHKKEPVAPTRKIRVRSKK